MIADNVAVTSVPRVKFLHRFATDEIDASDIARVVNESYDVECSVNGQHSFRQPGPKISASEIELNLFDLSSELRWIVLEPLSPEESVVAAARLQLDSSKKAAVIEYLCSIGDSIDELNGRFSTLLTKIESIAYSQNYHNILLHTSSWRDDTQRLLTAAHYADIGGCLDESHASLSYTKPSMILCFMKELKPFHSSSNITAVAKQMESASRTAQTLKVCSTDTVVECSSLNNLSSPNCSLKNIPGESYSQHAECSTISHEVKEIENEVIHKKDIDKEIKTFTSLHAKQECSLQKLDFDFSEFHMQEKIIFNDTFQNNLNSVESSGSMEGILTELFSAMRSDKAFLSEEMSS